MGWGYHFQNFSRVLSRLLIRPGCMLVRTYYITPQRMPHGMQKYGMGCKNTACVSQMARGCEQQTKEQGRGRWTNNKPRNRDEGGGPRNRDEGGGPNRAAGGSGIIFLIFWVGTLTAFLWLGTNSAEEGEVCVKQTF
jgi:hypothetical protein